MEGNRSHQPRGAEILTLNQVIPFSASLLVLRTLILFGTGSQLFLKMSVCSVNNDILLIIHVTFIILQMSDFSRLALDVYVFYKIWL